MRQSTDQFQDGMLQNGYDYEHQAWVAEGRYLRCGHETDCSCFGRLHEGERVATTGKAGKDYILR